MSVSGSRRSPYAASNTNVPDRAPGGGSASSAAGQAAFSASANNTATATHRLVGSGTQTIVASVTITPVVSGKFQLSSALGVISSVAGDTIGWILSDGTSTLASGAAVSDAGGNANLSLPRIAGIYPLGTPVTFSLTAVNGSSTHTITSTGQKAWVDAFEFAG